MMDGIKDKIKEAQKAGYGDDEIVQFLAQMPTVGTQINTALENQYKPSEILKFLSESRSKAFEAGAKLGTTTRALASAAGGPTFGFADELAGFLGAPMLAMQKGVPLSDAYTMGRDIFRGAAESYQKESPYYAAAGQLAASVPMMIAGVPGKVVQEVGKRVMPAIEAAAPSIAPAIARAGQYIAGAPAAGQIMGMGQRAVQAGVSGAGYGLLGGIGESTGQTAEEILRDAGKSALIGGTLGAVSQPVMGIVGAGGRQVMARVSPTAAGTYAQQKVGEALIRDVPEGLAPSALTMAQARLAKLGPEARIADVGGKSTRNLLDVQATLPGTTTEAVERAIRERQAGRAGRLMTAADQSLGTQGAQFTQKLEDFSAQRFAESRPFYNAIDKAALKVDNTLADALNKSQAVQGSAELLFRTKTGQTIDLAKLKVGDPVPMNVLDTLKQSLYDTAQSLRRTGSNAQANAYDDVRKQLVGVLEAQSPKIGGQSAYTMAMKTWAGPSQMMDAAEVGRKAMTGDVLELGQTMKGFTPSEIDAFRIGALQALRQKTGTEAGQTSLLKMWKEPATQDRLKEVFGNDYRTFASAVAKEARLKGLESAGRGSQTAARLAGTADLEVAPLGQAAAAAAAGSPTGMLAAASNIASQTRTPEAVRNEIGKILLSRDQQQLTDLAEVIRRLNESRARAAGISGRTSGQIGSMLPGYVGQ
jgi:hypothetical protein